MSREPLLDDYRWLTRQETLLAELSSTAAGDPRKLLSQAKHLRRDHSASRTHLLLEQVDLRRRALAKFPRAEGMFFTPQGLQQATDHWLAAYKSQRFATDEKCLVADVCCGIGGDLQALASRCPALAIDSWEPALVLAAANLSPATRQNTDLRHGRAESVSVPAECLLHVDPDRRSSGSRVSQLAGYSPGQPWLEQQMAAAGRPGTALKLAPAAIVPDDWSDRGQREWLESRGECRQQVLWTGRLAREGTAVRTATGITSDTAGTDTAGTDSSTANGSGAFSVRYSYTASEEEIASASVEAGTFRWLNFLYEPPPAVRASGLSTAIAMRCDLCQPSTTALYFTSDDLLQLDGWQVFEVSETLPYDMRKIRQALRARDIGCLEIKGRGPHANIDRLLKNWRGTGTNSTTIVIAGSRQQVTAIICRRLP